MTTAAASLPAGIARDVVLAPYTSWQVGGPADFFASPVSVEDLRRFLAWAGARPVTVLSGGTNVLISDRGVRGLVICLRKLSGLNVAEHDGNLEITALAGTSKSELLKTFLRYKLEPALFLAGLPGDVGGGVAMNAGVGELMVPREFREITEWVEVLRADAGSLVSGPPRYEVVRLRADELNWSYRHCVGWQPGVIVRVGLKWPLTPSADVLARVKAANQVRLSKQPLDLPSCGSVFVNPPAHKAGQLIEGADLKGYTVGGAQVSMKHANFIVNLGGATASDLHAVIEHARTTVLARSAVELKTEVVYLGDW